MARLRDLKDALKGKERRVNRLEEAMRGILLACESADMGHSVGSVHAEALEIIKERAKEVLT